jgi:hypothetical protein
MKFVRIISPLIFIHSFVPLVLAQGTLTPPGAPAPTMKTLAQIEPRTPISALPATITTSGSYYLTTNLMCITCTSNQNGITILADNVSLDLNGFVVQGVSGSSAGISVPGVQRNLRISNGVVSQWGLAGIDTRNATSCLLENLQTSYNGVNGIDTGVGSTVLGCLSSSNTASGIVAFNGCVVRNCTATANHERGIWLSPGSTVSDCACTTNGSNGFQVGSQSTVSRCTAIQNGTDGFGATDFCLVIESTAIGNSRAGVEASSCSTIRNCMVAGNGDGVRVISNCFVVANNCQGNGNSGVLLLGSRNTVEDNLLCGASIGVDATIGGNLIIRNAASSNSQNYVFVGAQRFGPTNNLADATGMITNLNSWANLSY